MSQVKVSNDGVILPQPCILTPRAARTTFTPCGENISIRAKVYIDEDGNKCAAPGDVIDMRAYKNSSLAATDLATIKARYDAGDLGVVNMRVGSGGDLVGLPHDRMELEALLTKTENAFSQLPKEIKSLFNSSTDFFNALLDGKVNEIIEKSKANVEQPKEVSKEDGGNK